MTVETIINKERDQRTSRPALLNQMVRTVKQRRLFTPGQRLLVAVSGGPDSMALLSLLHELVRSWDLSLTVVHFNYGLRGRESDTDESFVRSWCDQWGIPFIVQRPVLPKRRGVSSLQAAAREVRYGAMKQIARDLNADRIVVGHTANDQAETMLMWMLRGAGLSGLAGMPYVREGIIVRPLLASTREEVLAYLDQKGLPHRHDASNDKPLYERNRIRKEVMPVLARLRPAAVRVLQRQAEMLRDDEVYLERVADGVMSSLVSEDQEGRQRFNHQGIASLPVALQRRLIRRVLRKADEQKRAPSLRVVEAVRQFLIKGRPGARLMMRSGLLIQKQDYAEFSRPPDGRLAEPPGADRRSTAERLVTVPSVMYWGRRSYRIQVQLMTRDEAVQLPPTRSAHRALFDADKSSEPLVVRRWQPGDRFHPTGMRGRTKKLQDLFTDLKIGREDRGDIPILVAPEGILWVIGKRQDERFVVRDSTTRCLVVTVTRQDEREGAL
jgi:tRNA(Ile)-lysidine synthase